MEKKYGNSFKVSQEGIQLAAYTPWVRTEEFYPGGAYVKVGTKYPVNNSPKSLAVGDKIPLGSAVYMSGLGSQPAFKLSSEYGVEPSSGYFFVGLTYEDAYVGEEGCSLTIVTRGTLNRDNLETKLPDEHPGIIVC